jgi:Flp pilus assembly pilin Flp
MHRSYQRALPLNAELSASSTSPKLRRRQGGAPAHAAFAPMLRNQSDAVQPATANQRFAPAGRVRVRLQRASAAFHEKSTNVCAISPCRGLASFLQTRLAVAMKHGFTPRLALARLHLAGVRLNADQRGSVMLEYSILIGAVALAGALGLVAVGISVVHSFDFVRRMLLSPIP